MLSENAVNIKVRIKFSKTGSLKFISHLDLQRTMQSSFLRSKLPIYYSEGFNPHPKVVFSPPLSVGVSSLTEFVDVKMLENVSFTEIMEKLNASFPKGLRAHECYTPETKFNDVKWGLYEIKYELVGEIPADICEKAKAALTAEEINVEKFSKKTGAKTVNIAGVLFTKNNTTKLASEVKTAAVELYEKHGVAVFGTTIGTFPAPIGESQLAHQSLFDYAPKSKVTQQYTAAIEEMLAAVNK